MLVWLRDMTKMKLDPIRADIPWYDKDLAQQVLHLQPADRSGVSHWENATNVTVSTDGQILNFFHPAEAFRCNLRAYISTVLPALICRMDVPPASFWNPWDECSGYSISYKMVCCGMEVLQSTIFKCFIGAVTLEVDYRNIDPFGELDSDTNRPLKNWQKKQVEQTWFRLKKWLLWATNLLWTFGQLERQFFPPCWSGSETRKQQRQWHQWWRGSRTNHTCHPKADLVSWGNILPWGCFVFLSRRVTLTRQMLFQQ